MAQSDEDRFRLRLGAPRRTSAQNTQRFTRQVLRAAQKSGSGSGRPLGRGRSRGAEKGRGHVAAKLVGARLSPRARRVVVKARLVVHAKAAPGSTAAHLRYIQRDSVTREGERGHVYSAAQDLADADAFEARVLDDRHEFRFILSPEDAEELGDLRAFTRDLMGRMEADLGTKLDWVAVDHWDTDNPHTHIVLRGVDETGADLVIARDYISHGMRGRGSELATEQLGIQTEREMRERMTREIGEERWTGLDRQLAEIAHDGAVDLSDVFAAADGGFRRRLLTGRLRELERLGLAEQQRGDRWTISASAEPTLRTLGERGDIVRTMQRAMGDKQRALVIHDGGDTAASPVVGRIAAKGLVDELQDRGFLVVDGLDGRAHYVRLPDRPELAAFPVGGVVEVRGAAREPRPADRAIAAETGLDGIYRADRHLAAARAATRPGDDPDGYVAAHVRRLEAMRQAGIVDRLSAGVWRVPPDYLDRAAAHEASRSAGAVIELRSHLDIRAQARAIGATWLDRALIEDVRAAPVGFGAEVRAALDDRRSMLEAEGLATRRGQRLILARDLLASLRTRDVAQAGKRIAGETGLDHQAVGSGDTVRGVYRRSVMLASGRFAMLEDGVGFSLVPWKPVLEQQLGREMRAMVRGGSVSFEFSRQRGLGV